MGRGRSEGMRGRGRGIGGAEGEEQGRGSQAGAISLGKTKWMHCTQLSKTLCCDLTCYTWAGEHGFMGMYPCLLTTCTGDCQLASPTIIDAVQHLGPEAQAHLALDEGSQNSPPNVFGINAV